MPLYQIASTDFILLNSIADRAKTRKKKKKKKKKKKQNKKSFNDISS